MPMSSAASPQNPPRARHHGLTHAAVTIVGAFAMLVSPIVASDAQSAAPQASAWELRFTSGAFIPTGSQRDVLKDAQLSAAQLSWVARRRLAVTATFGWARSRDLGSIDLPRVDVFTYDLGAEVRGSEWLGDRAVAFTPFAGAGAGARSYNYRNLNVDATHNAAGYGTVGGELGMGRVGLRLEVREYVAGFKPLAGGGRADTRNDAIVMVGLRFDRHHTVSSSPAAEAER